MLICDKPTEVNGLFSALKCDSEIQLLILDVQGTNCHFIDPGYHVLPPRAVYAA